jgi:hypothetical protein
MYNQMKNAAKHNCLPLDQLSNNKDACSDNSLGRKKLTIEELEKLANKNNPTFSKERNSYGGFTTKCFNTLKINH